MYTFDVERMFILHQNSGGIGKSIPSALQISLDPLGSREIFWASEMDLPIPPSFWWSTDTVKEISRSREISRAEGMDFPIPPESWWSTDILSSLPGKDLLMHSL